MKWKTNFKEHPTQRHADLFVATVVFNWKPRNGDIKRKVCGWRKLAQPFNNTNMTSFYAIWLK